MLSESIRLLDPIISAFDWLDRYGWVARPVTRTFPLKGGKKSISETFPMSVGVSRKECFEKNLYYLTPDPRFASLGYWELIGDYRKSNVNTIPGGKGIELSFTARLVIWYNAKSLGYDTNSLNSDIFLTLLTTLDDHRLDNPNDYPAISIEYSLKRIITEKNKIFNRYSYRSSHDYLFEPPNGYLAAEFDIRIITTRDCLPLLTLGTEEFCDISSSVDESSIFPDWSKDSYQRFVSAGESTFEVSDFKIQDVSTLSVDQVEQLYIVFLEGVKAEYIDTVAPGPGEYSIQGKEIRIDNNHYLTGTKIEIYKR